MKSCPVVEALVDELLETIDHLRRDVRGQFNDDRSKISGLDHSHLLISFRLYPLFDLRVERCIFIAAGIEILCSGAGATTRGGETDDYQQKNHQSHRTVTDPVTV